MTEQLTVGLEMRAFRMEHMQRMADLRFKMNFLQFYVILVSLRSSKLEFMII